jgi:predicted DsbA family dithiol-disulfide isomerase
MRRPHAVALAALIAAACSRPSGSAGAVAKGSAPSSKPASPATASPGEAVAELDGVPITRAELDARVEGGLTRLRQEEYDLRREALDKLIAERLIDAEAARRGVSREQLLRQEVDARVAAPLPGQAKTLYEQNRSRFAGQAPDQAIAELQKALAERATNERRSAFEKELRGRARVATHLEPPRGKAEVPAHAPATGPAEAKVTIVEYTDYQCPFCHRAQTVIDELLSRYAGKVRLVHMDFPLEGHPGAVPAARAARCAGEQGRFWEYHHSLMTVQGLFNEADLKSRASALHLDAGTFASCIGSSRHDADIQAQLQHGTEVGVTGTPSYFINGRMMVGARPLQDFAQVIDAELGAAP